MSRFIPKQHILLRLMVLAVCALLLAPVFAVSAAPLSEGSIGRLTWSIYEGTLSIRGRDAVPDYTDRNPAPWHEYRDSIVRLELEGITAIGSMAFYDCVALREVDLPRTVKTVGDMAFAGCESLTTVHLPEVKKLGEYAFSRCFSLKNVVLPNTLTEIGGYAFYRCESLPYICIPSSVVSLDSSAFAYNYSLLYVDIEAPLTALPEWCFYGCERLQVLTVPAVMTEVGDSAFTRCAALTMVYHGGTDEARKAFSDEAAKSLPDFTVSQMAPSADTLPVITNKEVVTEGDTAQEITTVVKQEGDTVLRVDQTVTYPTTNGVNTGDPNAFASTVYATIGQPENLDDVLKEIAEQINAKDSFESSYGEQKPVQAEITLETDMPLSGAWLDALSGRDAVVSVTAPDGSRFTIDGRAIKGYTFKKEYTVGYTLTPCEELRESEKAVVGAATCYWLTFHSAFDFPVTVEVLLDPYAERQYATLYEQAHGDLQRLQSARIDSNGYVSLRLAVINKTTRYLLAVNVADIPADEVLISTGSNTVEELRPLSEQYTITEVRGLFGLTMTEFTRIVLIGVGAFLGVVILLVLFFVIRSKRMAKIVALREAEPPRE